MPLIPATEPAAGSPVRVPNEGVEYRAARTALLSEEIELRRHLERVAARRRALPPGGELTEDDPGQDPRGAPDFAPLWNVLDLTPAGRGAD